MKLLTAYDVIAGLPTASIDWSFPGDGITRRTQRVPYGPIDYALTAFYNHGNQLVSINGDRPFFHIVFDETGHQCGLLIADIGGGDLDDDRVKLGFFSQGLEQLTRFPEPVPWEPHDFPTRMFWDPVGIAGIEWRPPNGYAFPAEPLNHIFAWFYEPDVWDFGRNGTEIKPKLYPVYNPEASAQHVPQVGVLISGTRPADGTTDEVAQFAREDFSHLTTNPATFNVPWGDREFDHA